MCIMEAGICPGFLVQDSVVQSLLCIPGCHCSIPDVFTDLAHHSLFKQSVLCDGVSEAIQADDFIYAATFQVMHLKAV